MSNPTPSRLSAQASAAQSSLRQAGRRGTGIIFAVMITVLLVALLFAANANTVIGWILVVISAGWLILATIVVIAFSVSARKVGAAVDSARADAAARRSHDYGAPAAVVDEDTHGRNLKLDHSFKIVGVQVRVMEDELAKGEAADTEVIGRALETMRMTAHNGRDLLADLVGRNAAADTSAAGQTPVQDDAQSSASQHRGSHSASQGQSAHQARDHRDGEDGTISGRVV